MKVRFNKITFILISFIGVFLISASLNELIKGSLTPSIFFEFFAGSIVAINCVYLLSHSYLVFEKNKLTKCSSIVKQQTYNLESWDELRVEDDLLYVQTESDWEKIETSRLWVNWKDWKTFLLEVNRKSQLVEDSIELEEG